MISQKERKRLEAMSLHEKRLYAQGAKLVAGVDEAGRGALAGPVVAAACYLPEGTLIPHLNDSKQVSQARREELYKTLSTFPFGIGEVDPDTIDRINILQATFLAMQKAVAALRTTVEFLLIDGHLVPKFNIPAQGIVHGDALSVLIAAASILAKVTRDRKMVELDATFPEYGFKDHKGYGTPQHQEALKKHGPCPIHRKTFEPVRLVCTA